MKVHEIMEHMIRADHTHRAVCDRELAQLGLHRSQHRMLMHLWHNGGAVSQRKLAEEMHITPAVVTVTLNKLEAEGFVVRRPSDEDRRSVTIAVTEAGEALISRTHSILDRVDTAMLEGFSEEEKEQLVGYYERMLENMKRFGRTDK